MVKVQQKYYDHYLGEGNGFRGILRTIIEQAERRNYVNQLHKNGQYCSNRNVKCQFYIYKKLIIINNKTNI